MKKTQKNTEAMECKICDFKCCRPTEMSRHLLTRKHHLRTTTNEKNTQLPYTCKKCNKEYSARNSLWYHENKCKNETIQQTEEPKCDIIPSDVSIYTIVNKLISENQDLKKFIMDQATEHKKETLDLITQTLVSYKPTTINNTQNNNNKFNINVYLNETCKDAMNFSDFIENIDVSYEDLENNVQLGFVNGIAKIFMDNLKQLKLHERPIHCTDVKREIMYLKENNVWTKQLNTDKLNNAVNIISNKGIKKLMMWKRENPDYQDVNSEFSNKCLDIQLSTMAGYNLSIYNPKVIHVIARETAITRK